MLYWQCPVWHYWNLLVVAMVVVCPTNGMALDGREKGLYCPPPIEKDIRTSMQQCTPSYRGVYVRYQYIKSLACRSEYIPWVDQTHSLAVTMPKGAFEVVLDQSEDGFTEWQLTMTRKAGNVRNRFFCMTNFELFFWWSQYSYVSTKFVADPLFDYI